MATTSPEQAARNLARMQQESMAAVKAEQTRLEQKKLDIIASSGSFSGFVKDLTAAKPAGAWDYCYTNQELKEANKFQLEVAVSLLPVGEIVQGIRGIGILAKSSEWVFQALSKSEMAGIVGKGVMTGDQIALKELVKEATLGGRKALSAVDTKTVIGWANEVNYTGFRASASDMAAFNNHWIGGPHIHLPGIGNGHIPIIP